MENEKAPEATSEATVTVTECGECDGTGYVNCSECDHEMECEECGGTGEIEH